MKSYIHSQSLYIAIWTVTVIQSRNWLATTGSWSMWSWHTPPVTSRGRQHHQAECRRAPATTAECAPLGGTAGKGSESSWNFHSWEPKFLRKRSKEQELAGVSDHGTFAERLPYRNNTCIHRISSTLVNTCAVVAPRWGQPGHVPRL